MAFNRKVGEPPNPDRDESPWATKLYQWMKDAADAINGVDLGGQTTVVTPPAAPTPSQQITITVPTSASGDGETATVNAAQTVVRYFNSHLWLMYQEDDNVTWTDAYTETDSVEGSSQMYMPLDLPVGCTVLKIECQCNKVSANQIDFTWAKNVWSTALAGTLATATHTTAGVSVATIYSGAKVIDDLGSYFLIADIGNANSIRLYDVRVTFSVDDLEDYL